MNNGQNNIYCTGTPLCIHGLASSYLNFSVSGINPGVELQNFGAL